MVAVLYKIMTETRKPRQAREGATVSNFLGIVEQSGYHPNVNILLYEMNYGLQGLSAKMASKKFR